MSRRSTWLAVAVSLVALVAGAARGDVSLASVFGENMVLQRGMKVPVWGEADAGEQVTVSLCGQEARARADGDGAWRVTLAAMEAGGPFTMSVTGKNAIELKNVLVGEVWVCSGQSNMAMTVNRCANAKQEIAAATFPRIRFFTVKRVTSAKPLDSVSGQWVECSPKTAGGFSGVGYFFGRKLHRALGVPMGLINTSWGGTPAEAWTSLPRLQATPELKPILDRWGERLEAYPEVLRKYEEGPLRKWKDRKAKAQQAVAAARKALQAAHAPDEKQAAQKTLDKARQQLRRLRRPPRRPRGPHSPHRPANLYNAMIRPLIPLAIRGAIWYQGESNAHRAYQYRTLFPTMIRDWRARWGQGDFPFYWVQLANFLKVDEQPRSDPWPELREAQTMTLSLPHSGQAVIIDIGEARDIHPRNKQHVGLRLALNALAQDYGKDVVGASPMFDSMTVEDGKVRVKFRNLGGGLVAKSFTDPVTESGPTLAKRFGRDDFLSLRPKAQVHGFAVAGADRQFVWADEATLDGDCVVVASAKVARPVAVRYAWSNNPVCNLYSKAGLP
ncbi:MAG: sialate O-acetylesterase, partial [Planctomycetota bacterium]